MDQTFNFKNSYPRLPELLKTLRKNAHLTQYDIGAYLHMSRQAYARYETGEAVPSLQLIADIAKYYNLDFHEFIHEITADEASDIQTSCLEIRIETLPDYKRFMSIDYNRFRLANLTPAEKQIIYLFYLLSDSEQHDLLLQLGIKAVNANKIPFDYIVRVPTF